MTLAGSDDRRSELMATWRETRKGIPRLAPLSALLPADARASPSPSALPAETRRFSSCRRRKRPRSTRSREPRKATGKPRIAVNNLLLDSPPPPLGLPPPFISKSSPTISLSGPNFCHTSQRSIENHARGITDALSTDQGPPRRSVAWSRAGNWLSEHYK